MGTANVGECRVRRRVDNLRTGWLDHEQRDSKLIKGICKSAGLLDWKKLRSIGSTASRKSLSNARVGDGEHVNGRCADEPIRARTGWPLIQRGRPDYSPVVPLVLLWDGNAGGEENFCGCKMCGSRLRGHGVSLEYVIDDLLAHDKTQRRPDKGQRWVKSS